MLRQPEFTVVLFFFCLSVFGWPFISIPGAESPSHMFYYLFCMWGVVIVVLFLLGRASADLDSPDEHHT